jgi:hypothetical protein
VFNGIEDAQDFPGAVAITFTSEGHGQPQGSVRILTTILTDAGWITRDVARGGTAGIEWWCEEQNKLIVPQHKLTPG